MFVSNFVHDVVKKIFLMKTAGSFGINGLVATTLFLTLFLSFKNQSF